jgi:hypothetical protein
MRGTPCTACNEGTARIVFWKQRKRFFFGCDASTAEKRCAGPKEWQSIDVPDELRVDSPGAPSDDDPQTVAAGKRERSDGEPEPSNKDIKRERS